MKNKTKTQWIFDILLLAMGLFYLIGINTFFSPCAVTGDEPMSCHWAGRAISVFASVLLILGGVHCGAIGIKRRQGVSMSIIVVALSAVAIPGHAIRLCMMSDMRCRQVMLPWVIICSVVTAIVALLDVLLVREKKESVL